MENPTNSGLAIGREEHREGGTLGHLAVNATASSERLYVFPSFTDQYHPQSPQSSQSIWPISQSLCYPRQSMAQL
jgi:hypothetical protein